MFTGLVRATAPVRSVGEATEARRLVIGAAPSDLDGPDRAIGASVAVSGVCLTVTEAGEDWFSADVAFETLAVTTLGDLAAEDVVNIEPSLRVGDALGGHLVSGHVDGIATVRSVERRGDAIKVWFEIPVELAAFVATKGSVCVDGVSLTVNEVEAAAFSVGLVPHTLDVTTLDRLAAGVRVNLEVDVLARYVARALALGGGEPIAAQEGNT